MATQAKRLVEGTQLTTAAVTYYTAPNSTKAQIKKFTLTNVTLLAATVTVYLVPAGGAIGVNSAITATRAVPGSGPGAVGTLELYEIEGHVLEAGDFIVVLCSVAATVTLIISGIEIV